MNFIKRKINTISSIITLIFLYLNLVFWQLNWLGWILFTLYILILGSFWQRILNRVFSLKKSLWLTKVFSWFSIFSLLGFISSIFVVFYTLNPILIWFVYATSLVFSFVILYLIGKKKTRVVKDENQGSEVRGQRLFKRSYLLLYCFIALLIIGLYLLFISKSTEILNSPWQTISQYFLPVFFVLVFLSGIFLFTKHKTKTILFVLISLSFLQHLYLPLSHKMPWGGDVWRHLAVENKIQKGELVLPVLFGDEAKWREVVEVDLPEVFLIPHKYTYGNLWGTSVLLSETLQIDLMKINKWLIPIVWSLVLPFILFRLGSLLFYNKRKALWLVWLGLIPFPLQALGALTLPNSLGLLTFLFTLMLWLQYLRDGNKRQKNLVLFFASLMLFGYSLYFILIWLVIFLSGAINIKSKTVKLSLFFTSIFIFPFIELISKISHLSKDINLLENLKQLFGQFTGWYYASAIRPHDILSGNLFFNHTPDYAFVENIFNIWRWWIIPVMVLVWILVKIAFIKIWQENNLKWDLIAILSSTIIGGYLIGWFILEGDRLFTRRLDPILVVLVLILFIKGISYICERCKWEGGDGKIFKILIILVLLFSSSFAILTYASGPDMKVMSSTEYDVANYIWENEDKATENNCVLADTWTLLGLEAVSGKKIVGGGFPIDYQFAQPERIVLYNEMILNPRENVLKLSHKETRSNACWFVVEKSSLNEEKIAKLEEIFNNTLVKMDDFFLWQEGLKKD